MKVNTDCLVNGQTELERSRSAEKHEACGPSFKGVLDREVSGADAKTVLGSSADADSIHTVSSFPGPWAFGVSYVAEGESSVLAAAEQLENALDGVSTQLEDEEISQRGIQGVLSSLDGGSKGLGVLLEGTANGHPLRQLGQDLSVLAYVESLKLRRGDYQ
jgi:hypothetical protein